MTLELDTVHFGFHTSWVGVATWAIPLLTEFIIVFRADHSQVVGPLNKTTEATGECTGRIGRYFVSMFYGSE
jgi:hypothetical protein